jgi:hypothetical protein
MMLVPCAIVLDRLATQDDFGPAFAGAQGVEVPGGTLNLTLLMLNFRDGMALRARRTAAARRRRTAAPAAFSR